MTRPPHSALLLVWAVLRLASGQDLSSLPACGVSCVNSVEADPALGCGVGAVSCFCGNPNFQFGIRDCVANRCDPVDAPTVTNFVAALCASKSTSCLGVGPSRRISKGKRLTDVASCDAPGGCDTDHTAGVRLSDGGECAPHPIQFSSAACLVYRGTCEHLQQQQQQQQ
ncbi:hypothetical protein VTK73DRAFT_1575 [Phialemonium thermophilum]|uniref:CFEM domain-containing protein n=1 Tax=Phialemonium thermophilum TaxID=223376 RepID=A0ABR3VT74_9PEZI